MTHTGPKTTPRAQHAQPKTVCVESLLPHRKPFLLVDRLIAFEAGHYARAETVLSPKAPYFAGHFPGHPIMPGVLIAEALAQTSGLLLKMSMQDRGLDEPSFPMHFLLSHLNLKFMAPAKPGDTLYSTARWLKSYGALHMFDVQAETADKQTARGRLSLASTNDSAKTTQSETDGDDHEI